MTSKHINTPITIRNADIEDLPIILAIGEIAHNEFHKDQYTLSKPKLKRLCEYLITQDDGIALLVECGDEVVGGIIAIVGEQDLSDDLYATIHAYYILPKYRKTYAGIKVAKEYIKQAKEKGANQIYMGISTGYCTDRVKALYERLGLREIGALFTMKGKQE